MGNEITPELIKKSMIMAGIQQAYVRDCALCGYPLKYLRHGSLLFFDSGCYCTGHYPTIAPVEWEQIVGWINMQDSDANRNNIAARFGLSLSRT